MHPEFILSLFCIGVFFSVTYMPFAADFTSDNFYDREQVQEIYLTIDMLNLNKMKEALPERKYVPASLRWKNIQLENEIN